MPPPMALEPTHCARAMGVLVYDAMPHTPRCIQTTIAQAEAELLPTLSAHVGQLLSQLHMPSHNLEHHLRVWAHCAELLGELHRYGLAVSDELIRNAMVACLFHDVGLLRDIGPAHGQHSAALCADFLDAHGPTDRASRDLILEAVARHDDKRLRSAIPTSPIEMLDLNRMVASADDLDAAGHIGVLRYVEIYHMRGIALNQLPQQAHENLAARRANLLSAYAPLAQFCQHHAARFDTAMALFAQMPQHPELLAWICKHLAEAHLPADSIAQSALDSPSLAPAIAQYLRGLLHELSQNIKGRSCTKQM